MAIVQTIMQYQFIEMMMESRPDNFTISGLRVLFDYLYQRSEDCAQDFEFDSIGIACDYTECAAVEVYNRYTPDLNLDEDEQALFDLHYDTDKAHMIDDLLKPKIIEYLGYNTTFVGETDSGSLVFADF